MLWKVNEVTRPDGLEGVNQFVRVDFFEDARLQFCSFSFGYLFLLVFLINQR